MDVSEGVLSRTPAASLDRWKIVWLSAAAATLLIFVWQWSFFVGADTPRVVTYALHHGYILAWLLLITAFTRTVALRTLAAFWFVGVFPVMAVVLVISKPIDDLAGGGEIAYAYLGPLVEELAKALPVVLLFGYRVWRTGWQLSASDGVLLGFMVGAGFAFHEDAGYGRTWGEGLGATSWSALFPTLGYFRGATLPYHDILAALVGLSIGFGFLLRRYRLARLLPFAAFLLVLSEHVTGNLRDIAGSVPFPADVIRGVLIGGELLPIVLAIGIVAAVALESGVLRSMARRDRAFHGTSLRQYIGALLELLRSRTFASIRRIQALRVYVRLRRALYYALWSGPLPPQRLDEAALSLSRAASEAGVPLADGSMSDDPPRQEPLTAASETEVPAGDTDDR